MQTALELRDDLPQIADGTLDVYLERRETGDRIPIAGALRAAIGRREAEDSNGRYLTADVVWHLPAQNPGSMPSLGDRIVELAGAKWTVLVVETATLGARWRCVTRNLAVAAGLDSAITIQRAAYRKGPSGAASRFWRDDQTGVPARIQPQDTEGGTDRRQQAAVQSVKIFLGESIAVDQGDRVVGPDGAVYLVTAVARPQRIDELVSLEAERLVDRLAAAAPAP